MKNPWHGFKFGAVEALRFLDAKVEEKGVEYFDEASPKIPCKCGKNADYELSFLSGPIYLCKDCNVKRKVNAEDMV